MLHVDLIIQLCAQTCNALLQRTLLNYWLRLILWPNFNAKWYNNYLKIEINLLHKISDDAGEAFTAPMRESFNKYADVFIKPGKPVARDIKHKIELLDPTKPIPHHRLQILSERKFQEVQECLQEYLEKG